MLKSVAVASLLLTVAAPAAAQTPVTPAEAKDVASSDSSDVNRIVCKKEEKIGSRLGAKKVCLTVKEWEERAAQDRDETGRVQRDTQMGTPSG